MAIPEKLNSPSIERVPEEFAVPDHLQDEMQMIETAVTANVKDDNGQNIIQTPQNEEVKIDIPYTMEQIKELSKGSIVDSVTWLSIYYWRKFKIAMSKGKNLVWRQSNAA